MVLPEHSCLKKSITFRPLLENKTPGLPGHLRLPRTFQQMPLPCWLHTQTETWAVSPWNTWERQQNLCSPGCFLFSANNEHNHSCLPQLRETRRSCAGPLPARCQSLLMPKIAEPEYFILTYYHSLSEGYPPIPTCWGRNVRSCFIIMNIFLTKNICRIFAFKET